MYSREEKKQINTLLEIMRALRDPDHGCPWDKEQVFKTVVPYTIEEAYEVAGAIEHEDMDELCDELGDLLFQVVFHARMAEENGDFDFADVVHAIADKMLRRHPHVFGTEEQRKKGATREDWPIYQCNLLKNNNLSPNHSLFCSRSLHQWQPPY